MKKFYSLLLVLLLISCSTTNESSQIAETVETTTTLSSIDESSEDTTTTTSESNVDETIIESYNYDPEKMSPFTGLELSPEIWLKRPRRVIAFKVDNNLNARPQSGLQEADTVMEILVEGGMTRFLAFFMDKVSSYVGPIRSARPTDPTMVRPYGGILVVSGATAGLILL